MVILVIGAVISFGRDIIEGVKTVAASGCQSFNVKRFQVLSCCRVY
jgi:hypothetical protein